MGRSGPLRSAQPPFSVVISRAQLLPWVCRKQGLCQCSHLCPRLSAPVSTPLPLLSVCCPVGRAASLCLITWPPAQLECGLLTQGTPQERADFASVELGLQSDPCQRQLSVIYAYISL